MKNAYGPGRFGLSFELFPPKSDASEDELFRQLADLMAFEPSYVTCTYGAGGSTQTKTLDIIERVRREYGCPVASHLTCVGATVAELHEYLLEAQRRDVGNIVALRGDPPKGQTEFRAVEGGLRWANELVALVRTSYPHLGIAVAGYPEKHLEAPSYDDDLRNLKRKVDCGADLVITQLFYDNDDFFRFRDQAWRLGITVPIVPGVLPITNLAQVRRITSMCGARLPAGLVEALERYEQQPDDQFELGVDHATAQVQGLIDGEAPGVHFYVLNKSPATCRVLRSVTRPA
ncbi:MAG TPA: methylenetetrahydrofolate reductase [NAD(P)H] [Pirellulales bacterium]|jgi:methylenetetrahydrofolate reductase (NADPH)|nr:methylenetetrahydrofolate reductase [NAD(P)H] [Pirellulales bacterium]